MESLPPVTQIIELKEQPEKKGEGGEVDAAIVHQSVMESSIQLEQIFLNLPYRRYSLELRPPMTVKDHWESK